MYYEHAVSTIIMHRDLASMDTPLQPDEFHSAYDRYEDHCTAVAHHSHAWCTLLTGERFDQPPLPTPDYYDDVPF